MEMEESEGKELAGRGRVVRWEGAREVGFSAMMTEDVGAMRGRATTSIEVTYGFAELLGVCGKVEQGCSEGWIKLSYSCMGGTSCAAFIS